MGAGGLFTLGFLVPSGRTQFSRERTLVCIILGAIDLQMREFVVDGLCSSTRGERWFVLDCVEI